MAGAGGRAYVRPMGSEDATGSRNTAAVEDVAHLLVRCLRAEGVEYVFGIPGEENIRFVDALNGSGIRYVLVRHEQAASFMAEIYGRLTGRAGVCSATLGPGAINLLLGTADATTNSAPMVALAAQGSLRRTHKESHQVIDLVSMFAPVTQWAAQIECPDAVPEMTRKAFKTAQSERPGAVFLAVPEDIEAARPTEPLAPLQIDAVRADAPSSSQIARAVEVLTTARHPVVLAGHGAARAGASAALVRFAEGLNIPVATTFHGKGVFPDDHPNALGAIGFMRHDYGNFGFDAADVLICVGYEIQEFDPVKINPNGDKRILHVHRFPAEVDAHYPVAVGVKGTPHRRWTHWRQRCPRGSPSTREAARRSVRCSTRNSSTDATVTRSPWCRSVWSPMSAPRWTATTSCSPTPAPERCGWPASTPPTNRTPVWSPTACPPWGSHCRARSPPSSPGRTDASWR